MKKRYRLIAPTGEEIVFGLKNPDKCVTIEKLNKGLKQMRDYIYTIPRFKNEDYCFTSLNALKYFLFGLCEMTLTDIEFLFTEGYTLVEQELDASCDGLSKIFCTYFDDEVSNQVSLCLVDLFNSPESIKHSPIKMYELDEEDVEFHKMKYYKNVKFNY